MGGKQGKTNKERLKSRGANTEGCSSMCGILNSSGLRHHWVVFPLRSLQNIQILFSISFTSMPVSLLCVCLTVLASPTSRSLSTQLGFHCYDLTHSHSEPAKQAQRQTVVPSSAAMPIISLAYFHHRLRGLLFIEVARPEETLPQVVVQQQRIHQWNVQFKLSLFKEKFEELTNCQKILHFQIKILTYKY